MNRNTVEEYIWKIYEMKSISGAAKALGISQPALSAFLKKHEAELGTVLFDRSKQPLEPTESGKAYLSYIKKHGLMLKELDQTIADIEDLKSGHLTVGGATFFNVAYLPVVIERFSEKYPGINLEIVDGKVPDIMFKADRGEIDLFISPDANEGDGFIYEEFLTENIYLAVPPQWEVNEKIGKSGPGGIDIIDENDFKELCENRFIVLKDDQEIGRKMRELFAKFQVMPKKILTAEQTMTTLALTLRGVGVSLITESSIKNTKFKLEPKLYMPDEEICRRKMYIARVGDRYMSRPAKEFIKILKEEYYEMSLLRK